MRSTHTIGAVAMTAALCQAHGAESRIDNDPRPEQTIREMPPALACAEMFSDAPELAMFSIEAAAVAGAVAERRREFGTVRYCAREARRKIGVPAVPILSDVDGAPRWPVGVVGSMTHCAGYRAAVVARSGELCGVYADAEPHAAVPDAALDLILRGEERARLLALAGVHRLRRMPRGAGMVGGGGERARRGGRDFGRGHTGAVRWRAGSGRARSVTGP